MPEKCLDSGGRVNEGKARCGGGEETRRLSQRSRGEWMEARQRSSRGSGLESRGKVDLTVTGGFLGVAGPHFH